MTDFKNWSKNHEPQKLTNALQNLAAYLVVTAVVVFVSWALVHGLDKEVERTVSMISVKKF